MPSAALVALAALLGAAAQPRRLRIVNGCAREPLWIAHVAAGGIGPDPQDVRIEPLQHYDFITSDGLSSTRYWPKMGCDAAGGRCRLGDSGGPGQTCAHRRVGQDRWSTCSPPVDTKFEATFGENGQPCTPGVEMAGCDWLDLSLVDGFTLPVRLRIEGGDCIDSGAGRPVEEVDCSGLSLDDCPAEENLTAAHEVVDLAAVNPTTGTVEGCYSPCSRLLDVKWQDQAGCSAQSPEARWYCCPTPPVSPQACRAGPVVATQYMQLVRAKCPGAYGYAYDDGAGLLRCSSAARYTLTYYCPADSAAMPRLAPPEVLLP